MKINCNEYPIEIMITQTVININLLTKLNIDNNTSNNKNK